MAFRQPPGTNGQAAIDNTSNVKLAIHANAIKMNVPKVNNPETTINPVKTCYTCEAYKKRIKERELALKLDGGEGHYDPLSPFRSHLMVRSAFEAVFYMYPQMTVSMIKTAPSKAANLTARVAYPIMKIRSLCKCPIFG
ncbi:MAG: hypothetical protein IPN94_04970 [Sphingobacteriales bacterium]|nr:hypothetical protein [Sphingobacteriales bacterium]